MKRLFYSLPCIAMVVCMVGCKNEDDILGEEPQTVKTPTEGSVVISELLKNGQVIEQSMDSLVNMGNEENPALFYVNLSHTVNGVEIQGDKSNNTGVFNTVTREELEEFIPLYAQAQSITSSTTLSEEEKATAYKDLADFTKEKDLDVALLVHIVRDNPKLLQPTLECGKIIPVKKPDDIYPTIPSIPDDLLPYIPFVHSENGDIQDSILDCVILKRDGLKLPFHIVDVDDDEAKPEPDPYNKNTYVSYINKNDDDSRNYYETKEFKSPTYACRYGCKGCPMVYTEFYIQGWYNSKHKKDKEEILYVPYLKTMINTVHVGTSMKLEGEVTYSQPKIRNTPNGKYAVIGGGEVEIKYGDSWLVKRVGKLKFTIDGETGFQEDSWNSDL